MYKFVIVSVLLIAPIYIDAAVAIGGNAEKPAEFANEEGCYVPELNKVIPYNDSYSPTSTGQCIQYTCHNDNKTDVITCGTAVGHDHNKCKLVQDFSKEYPFCCGVLTCDDNQ